MKQLLKKIVPQVAINYLWHLPKAALASYIFGNPSKNLNIIAVTGTDGKTTTTTLIYHILKTAGKKTALVSTVEARIGRSAVDTGLHVTSPDPFKLQSLLRKMKSQKVKHVCLEVTSHGLDQFRLFPIKPKIAVLTNITHEHLDYHKTFENYLDAKLRLFKAAEHAIVNKDLEVFGEVNSKLSGVALATYSIDTGSQLKGKNVELMKTKSTFKVGDNQYEIPLTGKYNVYNALAAISAALMLDVAPSDIRRALRSFKGVPGRLDITKSKGRVVVVDFAHTPNSINEVLKNLDNMKGDKGRLIAVFGSAGLRDKSKRPSMGEKAAKWADEIVLTAEDPRTEKVADINRQIIEGIEKKDRSKVHEIEDRGEAIEYAVSHLAKEGDWVAILGKGHEKSLNLDGKKEIPWSDQKKVSEALERI